MGFDCLVGNDIAESSRSNPFDDIFVVTRAEARALATPTFNSNSKTDLSTDLTESANSKRNVQLVTDKVTDHLTNTVDTVIDCDSNNPIDNIVDSTISTVDSTEDKSIDSVNKVDEVTTDVVTVSHDARYDVHHLDDEVNDSSLNCKVDVINGQYLNSTDQETDEMGQCNMSGISELFVEPKQITWNNMLRSDNETLSKW